MLIFIYFKGSRHKASSLILQFIWKLEPYRFTCLKEITSCLELPLRRNNGIKYLGCHFLGRLQNEYLMPKIFYNTNFLLPSPEKISKFLNTASELFVHCYCIKFVYVVSIRLYPNWTILKGRLDQVH